MPGPDKAMVPAAALTVFLDSATLFPAWYGIMISSELHSKPGLALTIGPFLLRPSLRVQGPRETLSAGPSPLAAPAPALAGM